jgi:sulfate adenylyltransferase (ADP) / ATP adenylyltransferase
MTRIPWQTGHLFSRVKAQHDYALSVGALQPIETHVECLPVGDIEFVVRILENVSRKEKALRQQGKTAPVNPFLPYEQALYVSDISDTHLCLLNKFNVVDYHFLIVTRQFEPQDSWLTLADFEALVLCLQEVDGLAFFNGGTVAGSSQPHKHLQVVPYTQSLPAFPMEWVIAASDRRDLDQTDLIQTDLNQTKNLDEPKGKTQLVASSLLPFRHAIIRHGMIRHATATGQAATTGLSSPLTAQHYLACYHKLLSAVGIADYADGDGLQAAAYNLLCNRQWMMIVPRSQERYAGISVNALGFAGSLLVKDKVMLMKLQALNPMELLQHVGYR